MLNDYTSRFEIYLKTELGLSKETVRAYMYDVQEFFDRQKPSEFTTKAVCDFTKSLFDNGLSASTVRRKCMSVRAFYNYLVAIGKLTKDIVDAIEPVRCQTHEPSTITQDDCFKMLNCLAGCNANRNHAIIMLMFDTGIRVSELCSLDINDIDFVGEKAKIFGKGSRERIVPMTKRCIEVIRKYLSFRENYNTNALFVRNSTGDRLTRRAITDMITAVGRRAGIGNLSSHTLRHSFATLMLDKGMPLEDIKDILGHQNLSSTQQYLGPNIQRLKGVYKRCHPLCHQGEEVDELKWSR